MGISMNGISAAANSVFAWLVHQSLNFDAAAGGLMAAVLFLLAIQLRNAIARSRRMRTIESNIDDLRAAHEAVSTALEDAKRVLTEATQSAARKSTDQGRKLVGELQTIENLIREFATNMKQQARAAAGSLGSAAAEMSGLPEPAMLEIVRRALEENRVELHLQPVVNLPQRKVRFYEALSRLRSEDGAVIMPAQFINIAAPAGLMSVVDNLLLFRCVQIVRRLSQKHRDIAVFCNISGHTLNDAEFFPQFLDFMHHHRDLAGQIIFEFTQDSVLTGGPTEQANLRYLANLGFRLSMDQVTKLDFDFAKTRRLGFHYLKLRAETLIAGMKDAGAAVSAEDLKHLLLRNGLNLIVERVEDEKTVVQLLEYNIDFGQGYLFGEPRVVRDIPEVEESRPAAQPVHMAALPTSITRRLAS